MLSLQPVLVALCPLQMDQELMTKGISNEIQCDHLRQDDQNTGNIKVTEH